MIDKSARQHYAMQGKIRNYLGKQKMVKAPVKWKSGPDHPDTELAYITKAEKDLILKADLHNSLSKGPNKGPSGIISLNGWGDAGDFGGSSSSSSGGGDAREQRRVQQYKVPIPKTYTPPVRPHAIDTKPDPITEFVPGDVISKPKSKPTFDYEGDAYGTPDTIADLKSKDLGTSLHGGPTFKEAMYFKDLEKEKMDFIGGQWVGGDKIAPKNHEDVMKIPEKDWTIEDKKIIEDWEGSQDWDKVKDLSKKGYDSKEIQDAMDKGLLTKADSQSMQTNLLSRGIRSIRNIIPKTGLERSLLGGLKKSFSPTDGGMFDPKKMAFGALKNMALKKLGLGAAVPWLGLLSFLPQLFGKKAFDPLESLTNKFAKKPVDMSAFNKLGLYKGVPTDTLTAKRVGEGTIGSDIATGKVDLAKLITGKDTGGGGGGGGDLNKPAAAVKSDFLKEQPKGRINTSGGITGGAWKKHAEFTNYLKALGSSPRAKNYHQLGGLDFKTRFPAVPDLVAKGLGYGYQGVTEGAKGLGKYLTGDPGALSASYRRALEEGRLNSLGIDQYGTGSPLEKRYLEERKFYDTLAAHGGRIDKPLTGRNRYI